MSKEIGFYSRTHGKTGDKAKDREEMKAFAEKVLAPERIRRTKGLMWIDDEGMAQLEAALKMPDEPKTIDPDVIEVLIRSGAKNPRYEFGFTDSAEKIGVMIPNGMKGKLNNRKVKVEVVTFNDSEKQYRLQCPQFQSLSS